MPPGCSSSSCSSSRWRERARSDGLQCCIRCGVPQCLVRKTCRLALAQQYRQGLLQRIAKRVLIVAGCPACQRKQIITEYRSLIQNLADRLELVEREFTGGLDRDQNADGLAPAKGDPYSAAWLSGGLIQGLSVVEQPVQRCWNGDAVDQDLGPVSEGCRSAMLWPRV